MLLGGRRVTMVYFSAKITKVDTTKYSIMILMCQLINEIDRYGFILQACLPHKDLCRIKHCVRAMPFLWDFWHIKRRQTERLSCSPCECKGVSNGVI